MLPFFATGFFVSVPKRLSLTTKVPFFFLFFVLEFFRCGINFRDPLFQGRLKWVLWDAFVHREPIKMRAKGRAKTFLIVNKWTLGRLCVSIKNLRLWLNVRWSVSTWVGRKLEQNELSPPSPPTVFRFVYYVTTFVIAKHFIFMHRSNFAVCLNESFKLSTRT